MKNLSQCIEQPLQINEGLVSFLWRLFGGPSEELKRARETIRRLKKDLEEQERNNQELVAKLQNLQNEPESAQIDQTRAELAHQVEQLQKSIEKQ